MSRFIAEIMEKSLARFLAKRVFEMICNGDIEFLETHNASEIMDNYSKETGPSCYFTFEIKPIKNTFIRNGWEEVHIYGNPIHFKVTTVDTDIISICKTDTIIVDFTYKDIKSVYFIDKFCDVFFPKNR